MGWSVGTGCAVIGPRRRTLARALRVALWGLVWAAWAGAAGAQQEQVAGIVVEVSTRRPVIAAQVLVVGTGVGATTDAQGRFTITNVSGEQVALRVVSVGYAEAVDTVRAGALDVVIELEPTALALDAIIVTGTVGETQARTLGNSVGVVAAAARDEIAPVRDVQTMLQGAVPGVRLLRASGEVGAGGAIRIRGAGSMSLVAEPLLYVDGVRVNNSASDGGGVGSDAGQPPSRINDINPDDIESIEVIKGPAAATLYGTEASNGVIQIITKRGRAGPPAVNVYMRQGEIGRAHV